MDDLETRMRIAWISYGFEEYSAQHANAMCQDCQVLMVIPASENGATKYRFDPSVEFFLFDNPRLREPLKQYSSVRRIVQRIREFKPDVVHLQAGHMWFNFALHALREFPLVVTIHDPRRHTGDKHSRKTPQWLYDYGYRKADDVIVHGESLADQVEEFLGIPRERIHTIPHVRVGNEATVSGVNEDEYLVLFFGRIWGYKGLDQLIAAQPIINAAVPEAKFLIAGEGERFDRYASLMQDPSRFIVHNTWISDSQRSEFFQRAALVALPYNEATQSGVVPVAYNFGKPVVATRVGALPDIVDDNITGLLVPPRDPQAIARAIIELLRDPERRQRMGRAGKAKLERECSPCAVAKQTIDVYRSALAHRGIGSHADKARISPGRLTSATGMDMVRR